MAVYKDERRGDVWRYRKRVTSPSGKVVRIEGTPPIDTKIAAEAAERAHIERVLHPERVPVVVAPAAKPKEVPTLKEFSERFMAGYLPGQKPGGRKHKTQILDSHLVPYFGPMALDEITQEDVDAFTTQELKRCARKTVNNRLAVLSTLLGYAHANKLIEKPTLRCHVSGAKAEDAPIIAVGADDVQKLLDACTDERYRVAILLMTTAGLRVGEARGAQWTDIVGGEITIRRAIDVEGNVGPPKSNRVRRVPLCPALTGALEKLPKLGLWVLCSDDGAFLVYRTMLKAIRRLYKRAGVDVPRSETGATRPFHGMRHGFGTECARSGVPVMTLRDLMGHEDAKTTQRYVTVTSADKRNAIELAFGGRDGQVTDRSTASVEIR